MTKEKKVTVDHKDCVEWREFGLEFSLPSFSSLFYLCIYFGTWEWSGTLCRVPTGPKLVNLLLRPPR